LCPEQRREENNILGIKILGKDMGIYTVEAYVRSATRPIKHTVRLKVDMITGHLLEFSCTCEDYAFRRRICKHIYTVYRALTGRRL